MACAKPMILSRQTNMTYYFNKNFYAMTETYPEDIAFRIKTLAENENLRSKLGGNAKKMIEEVFDWNSLIFEYIDMYKKIIKNA